MNRHYSKIQIFAHQLAWWGCVLAVKWQHPLWAAIIMFAFTLFHLFMTRAYFKRELLLVITATVVGGLGDSLLVIGGAFANFQPPGEFGLPIPLWMWGLWAGFGATLRYSMDWLVAQPWRGCWPALWWGPWCIPAAKH